MNKGTLREYMAESTNPQRSVANTTTGNAVMMREEINLPLGRFDFHRCLWSLRL